MKPLAEFRLHKRGFRLGQCRVCEREYQREYSRRDPENYRKSKRESMARRRAADLPAAQAYSRAYHTKNREKQTAIMRAYYGRRFFWGRAMKLRGEGRATYVELAQMWKRQRGRCGLTGRRLDRSAQLDHIVPQARGGSDRIENLRWTCEPANLAKRHMTDAEFLTLCIDVAAFLKVRS